MRTAEFAPQSERLGALLAEMVERGASDLHLAPGRAPTLRVDGSLTGSRDVAELEADHALDLVRSVLSSLQRRRFEDDGELDFAFEVPDLARFRGACYRQRGKCALAIRHIPPRPPTLAELGLPPAVGRLAERPRGMVLVTGPTGSGKSTTLAALVDRVNRRIRGHILTVEDPIEFLHRSRRCIVSQREIGADAESFSSALRHALRQDPDVILVGEMRDPETIGAALTIAETGHLVLSTLHTNSAADTVNRVVDAFPADRQARVRNQLASVLEGVATQILVPRGSRTGRGGRRRGADLHGRGQGGDPRRQGAPVALADAGGTPARHADPERRSGEALPQGPHHARGGTQAHSGRGRAHARHGRIAAGGRRPDRGEWVGVAGGVSSREVAVFTRLFATMIAAGLPLVHSLHVLSGQQERRRFRDVIRKMVADIEAGESLAGAMRRHPGVFSELSVSLVAVGEAAGALDTVLARLSEFLERSRATARKVKAALVYPTMIVAVSVPAVGILLAIVVPTFEEMFAQAGTALPLPTRAVVAASDALRGYWWALFGVLAAFGAAAHRLRRGRKGRLATDRLLLSLPLLGGLIRKTSVARFTRSLGTLVSSGVPILQGLEVTARTAGNRVIHDAVMRSRASIAGGATIAQPLEASGAFTPMVVRMIEVGEQTGALDEMLNRVADLYEEEVDVALEAVIAMIEPAMIAVLGIVVGAIVVAMYLPIFEMTGAVG